MTGYIHKESDRLISWSHSDYDRDCSRTGGHARLYMACHDYFLLQDIVLKSVNHVKTPVSSQYGSDSLEHRMHSII